MKILEKSNKELFTILTEDDVKEIVRTLHKVDKEKTKYWRIKKTPDSYQICISDIENDENLHPDNSTVIVLTDDLDLYQQGFGLKKTKYRVGNLFITYKFMWDLLSQKIGNG